eukprot:jgi/Botrbrau1/5979/Bobra.104_1s0010.1
MHALDAEPSLAALASLQEELQGLKQTFRHVTLRKAAPGTSPSAPFPVTATVTFSAPISASAYDVTGFKVRIVLMQPARVAGALPQDRASGVRIELESDELPQELRGKMVDLLRSQWLQGFEPGSSGKLELDRLLMPCATKFVDLITSLPELVEAYEGVNDDGGNCEEVRHHQHRHAGCHGDWDRFSILTGSSSNAEPLAPLLSEKRAPQVRPSTASPPAVQPVPSTMAEHASVLSNALQFRVEIAPSDPDWSLPPLALKGTVLETYPAPGSVTVVTQPGACNWDSGVRKLFDGILAGQVAKLGNQPDALRSLLRFVDSHASHVLNAAEDLLLETARPPPEAGLLPSKAGPAQAGALPGSLLLGTHTSKQPSKTLAEDKPEVISARTAASGRPLGTRKELTSLAGAAEPGLIPQETHARVLGGRLGAAELVDETAWDAVVDGREPGQSCSTTEGSGDEEEGLAFDDEREEGDDGYSSGSWEEGESGSDVEGLAAGGRALRGDLLGPGAGAVPEEGAPGGSGLGSGGLGLRLEGLQLDCVDAVQPIRLSLQVECGRCGRAEALLLLLDASARNPRTEAKLACSGCHLDMRVSAEPRLVHERSNLLAVLLPSDCRPARLTAQLAFCTMRQVLRHPGLPITCPTLEGYIPIKDQKEDYRFAGCVCETGLGIEPGTSRLGKARQSGGPAASLDGRAARKSCSKREARHGEAASLQLGQPLPAFGTCKHYRLSHRWLRFPCCGRRFPCDLCHEEGTDGHEMKWATRMVCGYCSLEQALGERCRGCNKWLARSASGPLGTATRHWQGGQGCRDKSLMDRRDAAKYRGSKFKTKKPQNHKGWLGRRTAGPVFLVWQANGYLASRFHVSIHFGPSVMHYGYIFKDNEITYGCAAIVTLLIDLPQSLWQCRFKDGGTSVRRATLPHLFPSGRTRSEIRSGGPRQVAQGPLQKE